MTHNEKRSEWWKEGLAALITGSLYGVSNAIVGHPLDTVKTKMQVLPEYQAKSMIESIKYLFKTEGIRGFFRGVFPPMIGGGLFRSAQFASFEALYTKLDKDPICSKPIPFTFGLEPRIILGGIASGTSRALIECPFEYSKVQRQTGGVWILSNMFQGFKVLWIRSTGLMTSYFIMVDFFRRNTNSYKHQYGIFLMNGLCATFGFIVIWPFEVAKNHIQSMKFLDSKNQYITTILRNKIKHHGVLGGLFRGSLPGLLSVFVRNGVAMIVMLKAQKIITMLGFRN
jgi:solute carrier family 25 carnitine/acylcarnitine transporter 20/29